MPQAAVLARELDGKLKSLIASSSKNDLKSAVALAEKTASASSKQFWDTIRAKGGIRPLEGMSDEEVGNLFITYKNVLESPSVQNISEGKLERHLYKFIGDIRHHDKDGFAKEKGFPLFFEERCKTLDNLASFTLSTQVQSTFADPLLTIELCKLSFDFFPNIIVII